MMNYWLFLCISNQNTNSIFTGVSSFGWAGYVALLVEVAGSTSGIRLPLYLTTFTMLNLLYIRDA